jgi:hypothetical protein
MECFGGRYRSDKRFLICSNFHQERDRIHTLPDIFGLYSVYCFRIHSIDLYILCK